MDPLSTAGRISRGTIGIALLLAVIPLAPWLWERAFPADDLSAEIMGHVAGDDRMAVRVRLENDGRNPQQDVVLKVDAGVLKDDASAVAFTHVDPDNLSMPFVQHVIDDYGTRSPAIAKIDDNEITVTIGLIRPGETIDVQVFEAKGSGPFDRSTAAAIEST
jgi:hypothetical protein